MNYSTYKYIPSFDECKQIVEDCSAFSHSTQIVDGVEIHSFKYNLNMPDMWEGDGRINMRGITYDSNGNLLALPFPKFFNRGEHYSVANLDLARFQNIIEKVDGSLISFFKVNGKVHCKTMKSAESDVAKNCREYMESREDISEFVDMLIDDGYSPMFEYVSKASRIVLDYGKTNLYFLGARSLETGDIVLANYFEVKSTISRPESFSTLDGAMSYLEREDVEGVVVTMNSGLMLKMKTEHYCKIHRALDGFTAKNVVTRIIENTYDDLIGVLTEFGMEDEVFRAKKIANLFWAEVATMKSEALAYFVENEDRERKDIAIELIKERKETLLASLVFKMIDGMDCDPIIFKKVLGDSKGWQI